MSGRFEQIEGGLRYVEDEALLRFLFDDGTTADVLSANDGSTMRGELLKHLGKNKIEGVATVLQEALDFGAVA